MNVSLTPDLEEFVAAKVKSGRYRTASEVVREALRLLEDREQAKQAVEEKLLAAIERGQYRDADEALWSMLRERAQGKER